MSFMFSIVFVVLACTYYFDSIEDFLTMASGACISMLCLLIVKLKKNYTLVFYIYSLSGVLITSYNLIFFHHSMHLGDVLWMLAGVSLAFFSLGRILGFILLLVSLTAIVIFVFCSLNIHIETIQARTNYQKLALAIEMIAGFGLNYYLFYLFLNVNHYSEKKLVESYDQLKEQNARILLQNDEKTTLLREVHHRVKNNLQIVVSLLRMQSQEVNNPEFRVLFQESINRIMAMSLIHQKLYQNDHLSQIRISDYLEELIKEIMNVNFTEQGVNYEINTEIEKIGLKTLIPVGLLINELVSNSLKHAFDCFTDARIEIGIQKQGENELRITYFDNGVWKPHVEHTTFGLILIDMLIEQLDGSKEIQREASGTTYSIVVLNLEEKDILA